MILKASQRSGGAQLAAHLLNARDNDHVRVGEIRGFASEDLHGAFKEAQAVASGTRCKQYLFSVSLNPPKDADVPEKVFEAAADAVERELGLEGQPRAIVFHEKEGRRHAHVVWSRIEPNEMRAINMAHFKRKLTALSRDLYLEHGWQLPDGLRPERAGNPLRFTLDEWQQARRNQVDPREIKAIFRDAWNRADSQRAFAGALAEYGYFLARGDRRGFVAIDINGEIYSVARWANLKTKDVRAKLGDPDDLPKVATVAAELKQSVTAQLRGFIDQAKARQEAQRLPLDQERKAMRDAHRLERARLATKQAERWDAESDARAARLRTGLHGVWDTLTGKAKAIREQNRIESFECARRDQRQRDGLIFEQTRERRALQSRIDALRQKQAQDRRVLARDAMSSLRQRARLQDAATREATPPPAHERRNRGFSLDR